MSDGSFAKVYRSGKDQILVKLDGGDEGPEVRWFFRPDGLGVCSIAAQFPDTDAGWDKAEEVFSKVDEATAISVVEKAKGSISDLTKSKSGKEEGNE